MKKLFNTTICIALCLISCSKVLDQAPDGKITLDDVWADNEKTMYFLNSCYSAIPQKGLGYYFYSRGPVNWCDDSWDCDDLAVNWAASGLLYNGTASAASHPIWAVHDGDHGLQYNYWASYFNKIQQCCMFIKYADPDVVGSLENYNRWIAEAHLLRAYYYSELLLWFGTGLPIIDKPNSYDDDFSQVKLSSYHDVVQFIIQDCDYAINCEDLPWRIISPGETRRVTKSLAWAIKSRMSVFAASPLYNGGNDYWEEAYQINLKALTALEGAGYELYNKVNIPSTYAADDAFLGEIVSGALVKNEYSQIYNEYFGNSMEYSPAPRDKETIYQLPNHQNLQIHWDGIGAVEGYKTGTCPSQELVDCYETVNGETILNLSKPYLDEQHLQPNYNTANTLYDPQNPYANRDPRFYATIYYNGSKRHCIWSTAPGATSFENLGSVSGLMTTRTVSTWSRYQIGDGPIIESYEPIMGRNLTERTGTRTGYYERKFINPYSSRSNRLTGADHKDYRFAEVILNFAEAAMEAGHPEEAIPAVNRIRSRVGMPDLPPTLSGEALRLRIHNERRVEFALEGNRYFDVRRWHKPDEDLSDTDRWITSAYITCHVASDGKTVTGYTYDRAVIKERQCYSNKYLKLAIPLNEANNMIAISGDNWQNPGW